MNSETKEKITETVTAILREADMDKMTEFMIRQQASDQLGINLSQPDYKAFVRTLVESYLKDLQPQVEPEPAGAATAADEEQAVERDEEQVVERDEEQVVEREREEDGRGKRIHEREVDDNGDLVICKLSNKRRVTVQDFKGKTLVSIREYYSKDGKDLPSSKGISLTAEQWSAFSKNLPAVEEAIGKMESRLA